VEIEKLRGYGIAASDSEGSWSPSFKSKIKKTAFKIVMTQLTLKQKMQVTFWFIRIKKQAKQLDLSDIREKGMNNNAFINQQIEYLSLFSALVKVIGNNSALKIMFDVMDGTAAEALLLSSPEIEDIKKAGEPFDVCRSYFSAGLEAARNAGCHQMTITENTEHVFQFDIHWCVWLELAKKMNVPEACIPNCYADDLAYPEYFKSLGINYNRSGTLAKGNQCCDFRFEKID
jgi:hypothetical protein